MSNVRLFKIIKRETRKGINLKIKPANGRHAFGFEELDGAIQSMNEEQAAVVLKTILKHALTLAGFKWRGEPKIILEEHIPERINTEEVPQ